MAVAVDDDEDELDDEYDREGDGARPDERGVDVVVVVVVRMEDAVEYADEASQRDDEEEEHLGEAVAEKLLDPNSRCGTEPQVDRS